MVRPPARRKAGLGQQPLDVDDGGVQVGGQPPQPRLSMAKRPALA
jgi:hypothetical protein